MNFGNDRQMNNTPALVDAAKAELVSLHRAAQKARLSRPRSVAENLQRNAAIEKAAEDMQTTRPNCCKNCTSADG